MYLGMWLECIGALYTAVIWFGTWNSLALAYHAGSLHWTGVTNRVSLQISWE